MVGTSHQKPVLLTMQQFSKKKTHYQHNNCSSIVSQKTHKFLLKINHFHHGLSQVELSSVFGALSAGFAPTNPRRESSLHNPRSDQICDWTVGEYQFFCQFSLEFSIFVFFGSFFLGFLTIV
jgi:hypothetical protein